MNAEQANDTRRTADEAVRAFQRALYRAAKARPSRRFHALSDKVFRRDILWRAWEEVKANAGAAGVDEQTIADIEHAGVEGFLADLATEVREGRYRPQPVRRVLIPKPDGRQRPLGIPAVRDRVVQAAVKVVLEPIFEADLRASSYGFRPKRNAHQAGEQLRQAVNRGAHWVVDADIEAFFDRIDLDELMRLVGKRLNDRRRLQLLWQWLRAGGLDGGAWAPTEQGVPQGAVISPLLANGVLHELDRFWEDHCRQLGQLIRYADDFVILCRTAAQAQEALQRVRGILTGLGLTLHPEKTRVVSLDQGRQGFDFLGFHCRLVESWRWRGRWYLQRWPSQRAMRGVRDRIKTITAARYRLSESVTRSVTELNRVLRGWGAYFRVGNSNRKFAQVDSYVRERLALFLSKKRRQSGRHWKDQNRAFFQQLGVYQLAGTVRWSVAAPRAVR